MNEREYQRLVGRARERASIFIPVVGYGAAAENVGAKLHSALFEDGRGGRMLKNLQRFSVAGISEKACAENEIGAGGRRLMHLDGQNIVPCVNNAWREEN